MIEMDNNDPMESVGSKLVIPVMPPNTTELQLTNLCKPYGTIRHQMLIQCADEKSSLGVVEFCEFNAAAFAITGLASVGTAAFLVYPKKGVPQRSLSVSRGEADKRIKTASTSSVNVHVENGDPQSVFKRLHKIQKHCELLEKMADTLEESAATTLEKVTLQMEKFNFDMGCLEKDETNVANEMKDSAENISAQSPYICDLLGLEFSLDSAEN